MDKPIVNNYVNIYFSKFIDLHTAKLYLALVYLKVDVFYYASWILDKTDPWIVCITRKYPLRGYVLGVLKHTTAWD